MNFHAQTALIIVLLTGNAHAFAYEGYGDSEEGGYEEYEGAAREYGYYPAPAPSYALPRHPPAVVTVPIPPSGYSYYGRDQIRTDDVICTRSYATGAMQCSNW